MPEATRENSRSKVSPDRILVVKLYAIGDVIMALPALAFLRHRFPGSHITFLTGQSVADLARIAAPVDKVLSLPERVLTNPLSRPRLVSLIWRLRRGHYSRAYLLHRVLPLRLLLLLSGIPSRTGQGTSRFGLTSVVGFDTDSPEHDAERYARLFGWEGEKPLRMPDIEVPTELLDRAGSLLDEYEGAVALSPGGGRSSIRRLDSKRWPEERFADLIGRLDASGIRTVLLGSKLDRECLATLLAGLPASSLDLIGRTTITDALAVLSMCTALVTNDSALMHIAGLAGTPTLSLFGPTDPGRIGVFPTSPMHRVVSCTGVDCSPCHPSDDWVIESCTRGECMSSISSEGVWDELTSLLQFAGGLP
jgi:lipopolysaccharide heptosyltransferase II